MNVNKTNIYLKPDSSRVLIRKFMTSDTEQERIKNIVARVIALSEEEARTNYEETIEDFNPRHFKIEDVFIRHYEIIEKHITAGVEVSEIKKRLIGAYFTSEYALESAALFNPSIVRHPDQKGLPAGSLRFIMSLRAIGEGHISSITFREGTIDKGHSITLKEPTHFVVAPEPLTRSVYSKKIFKNKINALGAQGSYTHRILKGLKEEFTFEELVACMNTLHKKDEGVLRENAIAHERILWLAYANYELEFSEEWPLSSRIIFPYTSSDKNGIEDARFVEFREDDGSTMYYATFVAFDGKAIMPKMLKTSDFKHFSIFTLSGEGVYNKGMALFPRRIGGKYAMIGRQDGENLYLMFSDNIEFWPKPKPLLRPKFPWEFIQIGNCGSPMETDKGWLVLTHGVGPMREYSLGAILLDKEDPARVIGQLKEPLLHPGHSSRNGYVPNVIYTCGALVYESTLILPYAVSDYATEIALVDLDELLKQLSK
ncbi:MAG: glycoside hydrolase family 130 protein [Candidatus Omnitrophica bacterium]|nr:glycoside hydrolase family 130 protein [Candidatus Omnitrophota bacterium]